MHLEVRHLRLVVAIAETGSVTRAAERVHLTQSAASHQLLDIESRLGLPLFRRARRRMVPTPTGEQVLVSARRVLSELEVLERDIARAAANGPEGLVRVTTECYTCYHWLGPVLRKYHESWPNVEVRVVADATRRPIRALAAGEIDLAVVTDTPKNRRFRYTPLFEDEFVLITAPGHRLAGRPFVRPEDLAGEPLVLYTMPEAESTLLQQILRPAGVTPGRVHWVQLTEAVIELVKAGVGVGALASWAVAPHVSAGTLTSLRFGHDGHRRLWQVATRAGGPAVDYLSAFIEMLQQTSFTPAPLAASPIKPGRGPRLIA